MYDFLFPKLRRNVNKLKEIMRLYYQKKEGRDVDMSLVLQLGGK